jgi:hypothetical protein
VWIEWWNLEGLSTLSRMLEGNNVSCDLSEVRANQLPLTEGGVTK